MKGSTQLRAQAQGRSSAANSDGSASRGSVFGRIFAATRASSLGADGSGAPSHRRTRTGLIALAIAAFALLALAPLASASKTVHSYFGNPGWQPSDAVDGGLLSYPRGVAVNVSGTGGAAAGDIYVVNASAKRIDQFSASGTFIRAFGRDVIEAGKANDNGTGFEICDTTAGNAVADCKEGSSSPGEGGTLSFPSGIAVNQATGHLYVLNGGMVRVEEFDATGHFVRAFGQDVVEGGSTGFEICNAGVDTCQAGTSDSSAGALAAIYPGGYLAVAPATAPNAGNLIVADPGNQRVNEYTSAGAFVRSFGFDVTASPETTTGFETCDAADSETCQAGSPGPGVGQFESGALTRVAVDSTGAIYTVETSTNLRVQKFTPAGAALTPSVFAAGILSGTSAFEETQDNPTDIAIGASDHVFVVKVFPAGSGTPAATVQERRVLELDSSGVLLDTHLVNAGINSVKGLAANPNNGRLYLTSFDYTTSFELRNRVYILADAVAPSASTDPVTGVDASTATLHGKANPGGVMGEYHFEYVDDAQFQIDGFASAERSPTEDAGNANSATTVSRAVADLAPSTLYHVRLVVEQTFGDVSATSGETTFTTTTAPPTVAPFGVADATRTAATLFTRVTANGEPTTYFFQWGPTAAYGNTTATQSAGSGLHSVLVSTQISGLSPSSTYHFRVVATNGSGTVQGPDQTFVTDEPEPALWVAVV